MVLNPSQIDQFIADGFVKLDGAFSRATAEACRAILWRDLGLSADKPEEWKEPVMRLGMYADAPFREAANSARLHGALDQLAGAGRWAPFQALGSMVVRFPVGKPWDDGWHIDGSFPPNEDWTSTDWINWRVNYRSRARAMLMLFLFSDCGPDDAPTRVRVGSHGPMARQLEKHGEAGISLGDLSQEGFAPSNDCDVAAATGEAGTVWLLHPLIVHAAQAHHGREARFLAQPGLSWKDGPHMDGESPVEQAIRMALRH